MKENFPRPWVLIGMLMLTGCGTPETVAEGNRRAARCAELGGQPVTLSDRWKTTICAKVEPIELDETKP